MMFYPDIRFNYQKKVDQFNHFHAMYNGN